MLRSDVLWRNGGRLLSVALLGGLALNAGTVPVDSLDAQAQGRQPTAQTWLSLENGWLCRSWSAASSAPSSATTAEALASIASAPAPRRPSASTAASAANSANTGLALRAQPVSFTSAAAPALPALFGAMVESTASATPDGANATGATGATGAASVASAAVAQAATTTATTIEAHSRHTLSHCTSLWRLDADGRLISEDAAWTPNPTGDWPTLTSAVMATTPLRASSPLLARAASATQAQQIAQASNRFVAVLVVHKITSQPAAQPAGSAATFYTSPGGIGQWTPVPGHPSYGMSDFAGDPNSFEFGVCTWWAWYTRQDEPQLGTLGVATNWISNSQARGMSVGDTPAVGATVVFQPGVQGAGGSGHVGHVVQLVGGGWFIISEMNFYFNGGGWGRVDYRYVHAGAGVAFIY